MDRRVTPPKRVTSPSWGGYLKITRHIALALKTTKKVAWPHLFKRWIALFIGLNVIHWKSVTETN